MNGDEVKCPYCGSVEEIEHDEGYGYEEDELYNQECGKCGKTFIYKTIVYREYFPEIAPCLNGEAEHAWKKCDPIAEVCGVCGENRRRKDWKENLKKIGMIVISHTQKDEPPLCEFDQDNRFGAGPIPEPIEPKE